MVTSTILMIAMMAKGHVQAPTSKELIEKMLNRYYAAKTLSGTIKLTVATNGGSASLNTEIQFEKPNKLYIHQKKTAANADPNQPTEWLVTSDGKNLTYDAPVVESSLGGSRKGARLKEPIVDPRTNFTHDIRSMYLAVGKSLNERSLPMDLAIARTDDLKYRRGQWINHQVTGTKEIQGKQVYLVKGDYQMTLGGGRIGDYQMAITAEGDLLQYVETLRLNVEGKVFDVVSQWDVDFKIDGPVNDALFKVVN